MARAAAQETGGVTDLVGRMFQPNGQPELWFVVTSDETARPDGTAPTVRLFFPGFERETRIATVDELHDWIARGALVELTGERAA